MTISALKYSMSCACLRCALLFLPLAGACLVLSPVARAVSPDAAEIIVRKFRVGSGPIGLAFDGANIWVVNQNDGAVPNCAPAMEQIWAPSP